MHWFAEFTHRLALFIQQFAEHWGGAGLFLVALVDSSVLTLPEAADLLVAAFSIREPHAWAYFAAMTTVGSVAGSYAIYLLARKGGEALVRRRFHERHVDRVLAWFQHYGAVVLIVPAMLPPPMPFKVFVLLAGVAGLAPWRFIVGVAVGRGLRYGAEAWLARWYGDEAMQFVRQHLLEVLVPVAVLALAMVAWSLWRRSERSDAGALVATTDGRVSASLDVE